MLTFFGKWYHSWFGFDPQPPKKRNICPFFKNLLPFLNMQSMLVMQGVQGGRGHHFLRKQYESVLFSEWVVTRADGMVYNSAISMVSVWIQTLAVCLFDYPHSWSIEQSLASYLLDWNFYWPLQRNQKLKLVTDSQIIYLFKCN